MTGDAYSPETIGLDEGNLLPPVIPAAGDRLGPTGVADSLPRADRHARLVQAKYRGVRLGTFGFVLEPAALYEIIESARISPLPGVTSLCKGLVNHRSNVVPVYDLSELTGAKPQAWQRKRLLILDSKEKAVGMLLYDLPVQIGIDDSVAVEGITDVPEIFRRHASAGYRSHGSLWLSLDRDSFFTELNTLCLRAA